MTQDNGSNAMAGGIFIALGVIIGIVFGVITNEISLGMFVGFLVGIALAVAVWFFDRTKKTDKKSKNSNKEIG